VPAVVLGRRNDVLGWNPMGHALLAGHLDPTAPDDARNRPNMLEMHFLDPHNHELYADWPAKGRAVVGNLQLVAGRHPDDPLLASLIGRLAMCSPEFARYWGDHRVKPCPTADYELRHPLAGPLTVTQQSLRSVQSPDQILVTCTAPAGSASAQAITLLAQLVHEGRQSSASSRRAPASNS
jgi:hypothetical protein